MKHKLTRQLQDIADAEKLHQDSIEPHLDDNEVWIERGEDNIQHLRTTFPKLTIPPTNGCCEVCHSHIINARMWRVNITLGHDPLITCSSCSNLGDGTPTSLEGARTLLEPKITKVSVSRFGLELIMSLAGGITLRNLAAVSGMPYSSLRYKLETSGFALDEYRRLVRALHLLGAIEQGK